MPELAELRLISDFVNKVSSNKIYTKVEKNPSHKGNTLNIPFDKFEISAQSRGKELILYINDLKSDEKLNVLMTMGMSGYFTYTYDNAIPKHAHLKFHTSDNMVLSFVDVRRFGKWKPTDTWSKNRGPDPTLEYDAFIKNIFDNLDKPVFNQPIHLFLMNQSYMNGIGNYLRAEILYRANINPSIDARTVFKNHPEVLHLCKEVPLDSYSFAGGKLKDWKKPENFEVFMKCYGNPNMKTIKDKNGRTFWYNPIWDL